MSGSPPQMETMGALHSSAAARQSSKLIMSLSDVEYSRIRPQPVQVRLQVCSGSSCKTMANFGVLRSLCLMMWPAIFADSARGNRIGFNEIEPTEEQSRKREEEFRGGWRQAGLVPGRAGRTWPARRCRTH